MSTSILSHLLSYSGFMTTIMLWSIILLKFSLTFHLYYSSNNSSSKFTSSVSKSYSASLYKVYTYLLNSLILSVCNFLFSLYLISSGNAIYSHTCNCCLILMIIKPLTSTLNQNFISDNFWHLH